MSNQSEPKKWELTDEQKLDAYVESKLEQARKEIVDAYDEYVQLLGDELNEVVGLAAAHGWVSSRAEAGEKLRARIAKLKEWGVAPLNKPKED